MSSGSSLAVFQRKNRLKPSKWRETALEAVLAPAILVENSAM
jgi:hypothetical protein